MAYSYIVLLKKYEELKEKNKKLEWYKLENNRKDKKIKEQELIIDWLLKRKDGGK